MKKYKGWEIQKMLDEKKFEIGEELTVTFNGCTKELIVVLNMVDSLILEEKGDNRPIPSSYFSSDCVFRKKLSGVTFEEALKSGKKVKLDPDVFKNNNNINPYSCNDAYIKSYVQKFEQKEYQLIANILTVIGWIASIGWVVDEELEDIFTKKCWYIEK